MSRGNLHSLLHSGANVVVDTAQTIRFAIQIAKGMAFLHSLERTIPEYHLNSFHVMVWPFFQFIFTCNDKIAYFDRYFKSTDYSYRSMSIWRPASIWPTQNSRSKIVAEYIILVGLHRKPCRKSAANETGIRRICGAMAFYYMKWLHGNCHSKIWDCRQWRLEWKSPPKGCVCHKYRALHRTSPSSSQFAWMKIQASGQHLIWSFRFWTKWSDNCIRVTIKCTASMCLIINLFFLFVRCHSQVLDTRCVRWSFLH